MYNDENGDSVSDNHDEDNKYSKDKILVVNNNYYEISGENGNDYEKSYEYDGYHNVDPSICLYRKIDEDFYDLDNISNSS